MVILTAEEADQRPTADPKERPHSGTLSHITRCNIIATRREDVREGLAAQ